MMATTIEDERQDTRPRPPLNPCRHCGIDLDKESTIIFQKVGENWHRDCLPCWRARHDNNKKEVQK